MITKPSISGDLRRLLSSGYKHPTHPNKIDCRAFLKQKPAFFRPKIGGCRVSNNKPSAKKKVWAFFVNKDGKIEYTPKCSVCVNQCKQSFRSTVISCPKYEHRREKAGNNQG